MDDVRAADTKTLLAAILKPLRLVWFAGGLYLSWLLYPEWSAFIVAGASIGLYLARVRQEFEGKRFKNIEHARLWDNVVNRLNRFRRALKRAPRNIVGGLKEMPRTVERTADHLYISLRKADLVKREILVSEGSAGIASMPFQVRTSDPGTSELYVLADKNVAEYRRHFETLLAKVTRTEGQCALFISALDSLRVQLLGYRLASVESVPTQTEFINTISEIKLQLDSINKALDELDLTTTVPEQSEGENVQGSS